jgi:predicted 3-demethylubiquinone-9 3-methyltransferase (glyoxalase superfamily)
MKKITPFLWFNGCAEEAVAFYLSVFKDGERLSAGPGGPTIMFRLKDLELIALNGDATFTPNEASSLFVTCEDQAEVDYLWDKLCEGGRPSQCGWLTDRYGFSWQIVPRQLGEYLGGPDRAGAQRALQAMLKMSKLDIAALRRAYEGETR